MEDKLPAKNIDDPRFTADVRFVKRLSVGWNRIIGVSVGLSFPKKSVITHSMCIPSSVTLADSDATAIPTTLT